MPPKHPAHSHLGTKCELPEALVEDQNGPALGFSKRHDAMIAGAAVDLTDRRYLMASLRQGLHDRPRDVLVSQEMHGSGRHHAESEVVVFASIGAVSLVGLLLAACSLIASVFWPGPLPPLFGGLCLALVAGALAYGRHRLRSSNG